MPHDMPRDYRGGVLCQANPPPTHVSSLEVGFQAFKSECITISFPSPFDRIHCQASSVQFSSFLQNKPWPSSPSAQSPPVAGILLSKITLPNRECTIAIEHI